MRVLTFTNRLVAALTIGFSASFALAQASHPPQPSTRRMVPNLALSALDGSQWSLEEQRGSIVLLNFWATWCHPCRTEKPMLVKLAGEYKKSGLKIAGVALDEDGTELVKKFVDEYKIDYPTLIPPADSPLRSIENLPNTLLIDREGRLVKKYVGAVPEKVLRTELDNLLSESSAARSVQESCEPPYATASVECPAATNFPITSIRLTVSTGFARCS